MIFNLLQILIIFPVFISILLMLIRNNKASGIIIRISSILGIVLSIITVCKYFNTPTLITVGNFGTLSLLMLVCEVGMCAYILYKAVKCKTYLAGILSFTQTAVMVWYEFNVGHHIQSVNEISIDKLSVLMILIVGIIGNLICMYAVEYMKDYHHHHKDYKDNRNFFFSLLYIFLSAMYLLVIANSLILLLFTWEITTFCSFLLIGYTKQPKAVKNSFNALTLNTIGGLSFAVGIVLLGINYNVSDMSDLLTLDNTGLVPVIVFLIAIAGLTKSAQLPFSGWLLGAMEAPTPTSAMLHSSTMVKAGVVLIIKLAPMLGNTIVGILITLIGGFTFFAAAVIAVSQSDAKKVLAYSTISNLGLIVACAGIDTGESIWAAIMLIVFHAIAKSLLFLSVGSTEHQLGSRDIEDMDGLVRISANLTILLIIGIAGMFLAPFGMLVSKWAAMKAFLDSGNILIVMLIAFGSSVTLFFWTKWMGKLIENANRHTENDYIMRIDEKIPLYSLAGLTIVLCVTFPLISNYIIMPYLDWNLHFTIPSPVSGADATIIILMMSVLFILPLVLMPVYKSNMVKPASVYLSGINTGDNKSFYGSKGEIIKIRSRNWYMESIFGEKIWFNKMRVLTSVMLITGFIVLIWGIVL